MHLVVASVSAQSAPATAGSSAPARVVVVEDPTDPWAVAGVVIGLLVGVVSVFLAWRAVRIGQQANAAAARAAEEAERANLEASRARAAVAVERRRTFELGVLYDLAKVIDRTEVATEAANYGRSLGRYFGQLQLVPDDLLPTWWDLWNCFTVAEAAEAVGVPLDEAEHGAEGTATDELVGAVQQALRDDVTEAIHVLKNAKVR